MMNQAVKARWVAALREPGRTQGFGALRNKEGNQCCLDILCELAVADEILKPPHLVTSVDDKEIYVYDTRGNPDKSYLNDIGEHVEGHYLPIEVIEWAELGKDHRYPYNPDINAPEWTCSLGEINDYKKYDFYKIAQLIEEDEIL